MKPIKILSIAATYYQRIFAVIQHDFTGTYFKSFLKHHTDVVMVFT